MLKGNSGVPPTGTNIKIQPVSANDNALGNTGAKVAVVIYEDFQCPFCERFFTDSEKNIRETYVKDGKVQLIYRDFAFLGPESIKAAEAARCAKDQGQFWEYHDYLFTHQDGENKGNFSDIRLKSFAKTLNLDTAGFSQCLDSGKYTQAIKDAGNEGGNAGVQSTPKGFILKNGKVVDTIDGAVPFATVKQKIDKALK
jgi:protein-disulfide isomerase